MNVYKLYHSVSWFDYGTVDQSTLDHVKSQVDMFEKLLAAGWRMRYNEHTTEGDVYYDIFGKFATTEEAHKSLKECGLGADYDIAELEDSIVKTDVE